LFNSRALSERHDEIQKLTGASWDWPDYQPHVTISYQAPKDFDPTKVEAYNGPITLGPEKFSEIQENWKAGVVEDQQGLGFQIPMAIGKRRRKKLKETKAEPLQYSKIEEDI
jgi:hypothetical protein